MEWLIPTGFDLPLPYIDLSYVHQEASPALKFEGSDRYVESLAIFRRDKCKYLNNSLRMQGLREAQEVLWDHPNKAPAWAVDVRNEKECDGNNKRKNQKQDRFRSIISRTEANQHVGADGDRHHQGPSRSRNAVPPSCLRVALRVQHIVHA
jgi:hypothetical protein